MRGFFALAGLTLLVACSHSPPQQGSACGTQLETDIAANQAFIDDDFMFYPTTASTSAAIKGC
jgi:hypothetical protein